jgi:hypothetical protein
VLWYYAAPLLCQPVVWLAQLVLDALPQLQARAFGHGKELHFLVTVVSGPDALTQGSAQVMVPVNVLIYCWNLPVLLALLFAADERFFTIRPALVAYVALLPFQAWGVVFDVLKSLALASGETVAEWTGFTGWTVEFIGLAYQFGYLMLPVIAAMSLWVALNRDLLNALMQRMPADRGGS